MQIKSRQRVRNLAEVYTHAREVNAMLDLVADMFPNASRPLDTDMKFFEPAAGSGNFLEAILKRKIAFISSLTYRSAQFYEHRLLRALASIYAIDIDAENVAESKDRLKFVLQSHLDNDLNTKVPSIGFSRAVDAILETNIIRANTLTDLDTIEWIDYHPGRSGSFQREWSTVGEVEEDLFSVTEPKADAIPIHYSLLADNPGPVTAPRKARA